MSKGRRQAQGRVHGSATPTGEPLSGEQLRQIRGMTRRLWGSGRGAIARALCREWGWRRPSGALNVEACRDLLRRLEEEGRLELPPRKTQPGPRRRREEPRRGVGKPLEKLGEDVSAADVDLRRIVVRPILRTETARWRQLMERHHYLGDPELVGESMRYVAEYDTRWLTLLGWGAAAWKSRHREAFIGWDQRCKRGRLRFVVNNTRFLILPSVQVPRLASCALSANLRRLSADWQARYSHPVLLAETFVDLERFRGTCYRASNWKFLGCTRGMGRKGRGYEEHGRPKALFVFPLHRRAREILSSPFPSPEILEVKSMSGATVEVDVNRLPLLGQGGLVEVLREVTDPRNARGIRHPFESVLALAAMAALSGMRNYEAIAEWAADVPRDILRELRCWCHQAPSEPTFRRVLQAIDADEIDRVVGRWLADQVEVFGKGVALDGKTLRGSGQGDREPFHLLAAVTHEDGIVLAQEQVGEKTNEIKHAASTLRDLDLRGATVTADAMHTQQGFARFLVEEKEADYVFIVKENQPTLLEDIRTLHDRDFSPSGDDDGQGTRSDGAASD